MNISNRLLGLLILLVIIGGSVGGFLYLFIFNVGYLEIDSNVDNFTVSLYSDKLKGTVANHTIVKECINKKCLFGELPPIQLNMTISKDGYESHTSNIIIPRNDTFSYPVELEKKASLTKVKTISVDGVGGELAMDEVQEKILNIKEINRVKNSYKYFKISDDYYFYLNLVGTKLEIKKYRDGRHSRVFDIPAVPAKLIQLSPVYGDNKLLVALGEKYYMYNFTTGRYNMFALKFQMKYAKVGKKRGNYIIVTERGSFIYDYEKNDFEYFSMFSDFLYGDDNTYIGLVYDDDTKRRKDYNIENGGNMIIQYFPKTKEKKVLLSPGFRPDRLMRENGIIYVLDEKGERYTLEL